MPNLMTNNSRVTHAVRGYTMKFGQVQKRIAENSCFVWVKYGETFRDATIAEAAQMRKEQATQRNVGLEVLKSGEVGGCKWIPPATTTYRAPREAYEEMSEPILGVRKCSWPRKQTQSNQSFALLKQANQFCQAHA